MAWAVNPPSCPPWPRQRRRNLRSRLRYLIAEAGIGGTFCTTPISSTSFSMAFSSMGRNRLREFRPREDRFHRLPRFVVDLRGGHAGPDAREHRLVELEHEQQQLALDGVVLAPSAFDEILDLHEHPAVRVERDGCGLRIGGESELTGRRGQRDLLDSRRA